MVKNEFLEIKNFQVESDKRLKMLFWSVFAGSKGCINRTKIVLQLSDTPLNTNQLSEKLGLDYKVVQRHIRTLRKNNLLKTVGNRYGEIYFLSSVFESNRDIFNKVTKSKNCRQNLE